MRLPTQKKNKTRINNCFIHYPALLRTRILRICLKFYNNK
jgi:hypothetical protein